MDLDKLIMPTKEATFEYPGFDGFEVTLCYLTRDELLKIRKKAVTNKFNRRTRQPEEEVDNDLFQDLYIKGVLKGWKGLKFKYLTKFLPLNMKDLDPEAELDYTQSNAVALMKNSTDFDNWVTMQLEDIENFTQSN